MWLARVICSGPECLDEEEVLVEDLGELDQLACGCSHGFVVLAISEVELVTH